MRMVKEKPSMDQVGMALDVLEKEILEMEEDQYKRDARAAFLELCVTIEVECPSRCSHGR